MTRPKQPERVVLTVRISPKVMERIDASVSQLQEFGESTLTKNGLVERMLLAGLLQIEAQAASNKKQLMLV